MSRLDHKMSIIVSSDKTLRITIRISEEMPRRVKAEIGVPFSGHALNNLMGDRGGGASETDPAYNIPMTYEPDTVQDDRTLSTMTEYACRYVLGRMTYAPDEFRSIVKRSYPRINMKSLMQMRGDIKEAIDSKRTGDERIDHPAWVEFFDWLEGIILERSDGKTPTKVK